MGGLLLFIFVGMLIYYALIVFGILASAYWSLCLMLDCILGIAVFIAFIIFLFSLI